MMAEFKPMDKIPRLYRDVIITEKLDGTNASVHVGEDGTVRAASRTRWITPGKTTDNYGFAGWVEAHAAELRALGPGAHFGEWWGLGINRGYGLTERRFSLFNVSRWEAERPACCHVVPLLYTGPWGGSSGNLAVNTTLCHLVSNGSFGAPGFMKPEGAIVYHTASRQLFKVTLDGDGHKHA